MHDILRFAKIAYIETQNLLPLLGTYTNPHDLLSRLVKKGELIRLKNGFFVIAEKIIDDKVPYEQIANIMYGPSYISYEWALSYYGIIPEGVYVITSASSAKSKSYKTPLGTFDYNALSHSKYVIGIDQQENSRGNFLIATPEKALADLVALKCRKLQANDLLTDLIEGRRVDEDALKQMNKSHLNEIAKAYHSQSVQNLITCVGLL